MKIVVVSDSHGSAENLRKVILNNSNADIFVHLGDGEREYDEVYTLFSGQCYYVKGNNDDGMFRSSQIIKAAGRSIYITHGHIIGVKSGLDNLYNSAAANSCCAALFGHTHIKHYEEHNGIVLFNPGSCYCPANSVPPSYGIITVTSDKMSFEHIDIH